MDMPKWARSAGLDADSWRRLNGRLYEIEPDKADDKPKAAPTKDPNAATAKSPQRTPGSPDRTRKDPIPSAGKDLQTRIKEMAAELKKKYGLPRDTGEKPPPPPPEPNLPPATGPASSR